MSLEEVHVNASETVSKVPYVRAPVAASVFDDANNSSGSSLSGESVFRDLIAFVNPGSGGRQGSALVRDLRALIGADRVFAIGKVNGVLQQPIDFLAPAVSGRSHPLRVVVCGGDGTVAWVISDADQLVQPHPGIQVFIIPLGTGNDLARAMLCGGGYTGRNLNDLRSVLHRSLSAMPVLLDRWELNFQFSGAPDRRRQLFNYFSVGLDARIARRFHDARESNPRLFFAQSFNKLLYGCFACRQCCDSLPPVSSYIDLFVDGQIIDLSNDFKVIVFGLRKIKPPFHYDFLR
jgi:diacylglycerol kinase (ATP)